MIEHPNKSLRQRAETLFQASRNDVASMSLEELQALVHEFQVHQIELEIQAEELREAQVELAESRDRYADMYEFAPVGFVTLDIDGKIHEANLTATTLLGLARQPLVRCHLTDFIASDSQDTWAQHRNAVFSTDTRQTCELAMHKADGTTLSVRLESIAFGSPPIHHCRVALIDLTDRKQAEEISQLMVESSLSGLVLLGSDRRIMVVNQRAEELFGYPRSELIGQAIEILVPHRFRDYHVKVREAYYTNPEKRAMGAREDLFGLRKDGSEFPIEVALNPLPTSNGLMVVATISDFTERKQIMEAMRESEERFRVIFEQAAAGVAEIDSLTGRFIRINSKYCETVGYTAQELQQLDFMRLTHPEDLQRDLANMECLRSGQLREFAMEKRLIHKDGRERWVTLLVSPMWPPGSRPTHHIAVIKDISQRKELESQLATLRDELAHVARIGTLGELASGLAHELNQPLTALHLFAKSAQEFGSQFESPEHQKCLQRIQDQSLRAGEIVRRMLTYSRRDASRRVSADVNQLVEEVLQLVKHDLQQNRIHVDIQLQPELPAVHVDPIQIQQVLVNLIRNAVDAMSHSVNGRRHLVIQSQAVADEVCIRVIDSGTGIDPEIASKLFHPFQTTKQTGLGLGLPICRTLIEAHGGHIFAKPNPQGGTIVSFTLPIPKQESQEASP